MFFQHISLLTLTWINFVHTFDNEDFFTLLCAADERNMDKIYDKCELVMKDAVDGCMEKCFIETRNRRSPMTRIDDKYYQFVMCDTFIWSEFLQCVAPCLQQLKVSYNGYENLGEWSNCMVDTVRKMENTIEHQDDPGGPKPGKGRPGKNKGSKGGPKKTKNNGKDKSKSSHSSPKTELRIKRH